MKKEAREKYNKYMRKYHVKQMEKAIIAFGGKCSCCKDKNIKVLKMKRGIVICANCERVIMMYEECKHDRKSL